MVSDVQKAALSPETVLAQMKAATRSSANGILPATCLSLAQNRRFSPSSSRVSLRMASISALAKGFMMDSLIQPAPDDRLFLSDRG